MKHKLGILLAATKNSSFTIGTLLINIMDVMGKKVDVFYILHDGFSLNDQNIMQKIVKNKTINFISFTQEDFLTTLGKNQNDINNLFFLKRWTHMAFARFEAFKFLDECESIIYLDFDVLLLKSIDELSKLRTKKYHFGARLGKTLLQTALPLEKKYPNKRVYQTGILVFNDLIPNPLKCYQFIYNYLSQNTKNWQDQGIFSLMIYEKHFKVKDLKDKYTGSTHYLTNLAQKASVVHACGTNSRFWNSKFCNQTWPKWQEYYEKWLKLGGSRYIGSFYKDNKQSIQRTRYHLSYKLGYAFIQCTKNKKKIPFLPFVLLKIYYTHKKLAKQYQKELRTKPYLKLPPLSNYDDYKSEGIKNQNTYSYKIGQALIHAQKNWYKGGYIFFAKKLKSFIKEYKNNQK
ncbi:glycosyl transferase [Campylobacter lari]|nr:glycosyl transferase [Campylobacter lari]EAK5748634.1 glycosyl transferase [Campylobacter lari]